MMQEKGMMNLTCWKSMAGAGRKCIGSLCVAWDWYDTYEVKYISEGEEVPEGYVLDVNRVSQNKFSLKYVRINRTGEGGCSALPVESVCNYGN